MLVKPNQNSNARRLKSKVHRRPIKVPLEKIVSLKLAKCVNHNLTDLLAKLEILKNHRKDEIIKYPDHAEQCLTFTNKTGFYMCANPVSKEKSAVATCSIKKTIVDDDERKMMISKMRRKKFKSFGKRFIKDFRYNAKLGDTYSSGNTISYNKTLKWFKQAKLLDNHRITMRDVEVHFINKLKTGHELKIFEFIQFLKSLCEDRGLQMSAVLLQLLNCRNEMKTTCNKALLCDPANFRPDQELSKCNKKEEIFNASTTKKSIVKDVYGTYHVPIVNIPQFKDVVCKEKSIILPKTQHCVTLATECLRNNEQVSKSMPPELASLYNSLNNLSLKQSTHWNNSISNTDPTCYSTEIYEKLFEKRSTDLPEEQICALLYTESLKSSDDKSVHDFTNPTSNIDPNCYVPEIDEEPFKKESTILPEEQICALLYTESLKSSDGKSVHEKNQVVSHGCSLESVSQNVPLYKKQTEWINPLLTSIPPQNEDMENVKKSEMFRSMVKNQKSSNTQKTRILSGKKIKLVSKQSGNKSPKCDVTKIEKKNLLRDMELTGKPFKFHTDVERHEYIPPESSNNSQIKNKIENKQCKRNRTIDEKANTEKIKIDKVTKTRVKINKTQKNCHRLKNSVANEETNEVISIQHFDSKLKTEEDGNNDILNNLDNKTYQEKNMLHMKHPNKNTDAPRIKIYLDRMFNEDLREKSEEKFEYVEIKNKEVSSDLKKCLNTPNMSSSNVVSAPQNKQNVKKVVSQDPSRKVNKCTQVENSSLKVMPSDRSKSKNRRTFTNLPSKQVHKSLQKSRKLKMNNILQTENFSYDQISKFIELNNKRKMISSKKRKSNNFIKKSSSNTQNEIEIETNGLNENPNDSPYPAISKMRPIIKTYRIRKGVRLKKKELRDPETQIQKQETKKHSEKKFKNFICF